MASSSFVLSLQDAEATRQLGYRLGQLLMAGTVLLLTGDLGSGKTTLVQGLGRGLGIADGIDSPTFTLINEYLEGRLPLYHGDLYRLEPQEVPDLNLDAYWEGVEFAPGILAIEWAERWLHPPAQSLHIHLDYTTDGDRQATITFADPIHYSHLETVLRDDLLVNEV